MEPSVPIKTTKWACTDARIQYKSRITGNRESETDEGEMED